MDIDVKKLIRIIESIDVDKLESLTFKVLINNLKTTIRYSKDSNKENEVLHKFNTFCERFKNIQSIQNDLNKYFK